MIGFANSRHTACFKMKTAQTVTRNLEIHFQRENILGNEFPSYECTVKK